MINVVDQFYDKVMLSALSSMMENILGEDTREEHATTHHHARHQAQGPHPHNIELIKSLFNKRKIHKWAGTPIKFSFEEFLC